MTQWGRHFFELGAAAGMSSQFCLFTFCKPKAREFFSNLKIIIFNVSFFLRFICIYQIYMAVRVVPDLHMLRVTWLLPFILLTHDEGFCVNSPTLRNTWVVLLTNETLSNCGWIILKNASQSRISQRTLAISAQDRPPTTREIMNLCACT